MNIYIHVEVKTRDLPGRLLLAMYSAQQGNDVYLGDEGLLRLVENGYLKPGIILEKSLAPTKSRLSLLKNLKKKKCIITSIDEEGGLLSHDIKRFLKSRMSKKSIVYAKKVFFWGNYDYKNACKIFKKEKQKFVITGNPRIQLWNKKYKKTINKIQTVKKYILISSNFKIGNSKKDFSEIYKYHLENSYFDDINYKNWFKNYYSYSFTLFMEFISLINTLVEVFPKVKFVVRPHPSESVNSWKNYLLKKNNLLISNKYNHSDWIENASLIIHNGCTGGVEAFARKKNVICYKPFKSKFEFSFPNKFGLTLKNDKEMIRSIKKIVSGKKVNIGRSILYKQLVARFNNFEKKVFCNKIIYEWNGLSKNYKTQNNYLKIFKLKKIVKKFKDTIIPSKESHKFPDLNKSEINNYFSIYKSIHKEFKDLEFEIIDKRILRVKKINYKI